MSLTNQEALSLNQTLMKYMHRQDLSGKFSYAVMRTVKKLRPVIETLQEMRAPVDGFQEFEDERVALCEKFAARQPELDEQGQPKKDDEGNVILTDKPHVQANQYIIPDESRQELDKAIEELRSSEKHSETMKRMEDQETRLKEALEEDADVELFQVKLEYVPDNVPPSEMTILDPMIAE
jgi:hypothetical protein